MKIMHTMASEACPKVPKRQFYSPEFKLQTVGECGQAGASIAAIALKLGVNANIVHRWLREHSQGTLSVQPITYLKVVAYNSCETRAGEHCRTFLGEWKGSLVCYDFGGYKAGFANGITKAGCLVHARRKFFDLHVSN